MHNEKHPMIVNAVTQHFVSAPGSFLLFMLVYIIRKNRRGLVATELKIFVWAGELQKGNYLS